MSESLKQQNAFEFYYMLGEKRTLTAVAEHFNVAVPTVHVWSTKHNWKNRVTERDRKNMEAIREDNDAQMQEQMKAYRKIINASVSEYVQRLRDKKIKVDTVKDFATLIRLDMEICGFLDKDKDKEAVDKYVEFYFSNK